MLIRCGAGVTVTAALLGSLAGCKGFQHTSDAASTTTSSSSAAATTAAGAASTSARQSVTATPFCTSAARLVAESTSSGGTSDPDKAAAFFDQEARKFRSLTPPAAVAADWKTVADGLSELSDAYSSTNLSDVQEEQQLELTITRVQTRIGPAQNRVNQYLADSCGVDTGGGTVTTPTVSAPVLVPPPTPTG